jgi:hypothetical protein
MHNLRRYGFRNVVTPADIYTAHPQIWPFAKNFSSYYEEIARPLPKPVWLGEELSNGSLADHLKIESMFVYNDPRDWGLDATIILDLLLSHEGYLGTLSGLNGKSELPNNGYQQDGQPTLWFSNPDLWWAASWHLNRLGQGGFREALEGLWKSTTNGAKLKKEICGKPYQATYEFAEKRLIAGRRRLVGSNVEGPQRVYMVGGELTPLKTATTALIRVQIIQHRTLWVRMTFRVRLVASGNRSLFVVEFTAEGSPPRSPTQ